MVTGSLSGALWLTDTAGVFGIHNRYHNLTKHHVNIMCYYMFKSLAEQQTVSFFAFHIARTLNIQSADFLQQKMLRDRSDLANRTEWLLLTARSYTAALKSSKQSNF